MTTPRDRLRRTRDGRYEVGVYIEKDIYARFVAEVLGPHLSLPRASVSVGILLCKFTLFTMRTRCDTLTPDVTDGEWRTQ